MGLPLRSTYGKNEEAGRLEHSEGQCGRTPGQEAAEPGAKGQEALERLTQRCRQVAGQRSGEGLKHEWSRSSGRDEAVREDARRDERGGCRESAHQARRASLPLAGAPLASCSPRRLTELELTTQRAGRAPVLQAGVVVRNRKCSRSPQRKLLSYMSREHVLGTAGGAGSVRRKLSMTPCTGQT